MSFDKIKIVKFVATGIVGMGTGKIVGRIIKNNITPETLIEKVTVTAAAWVISAVITKATKGFVDEQIDDAVETVSTIVEKVKLAEKLGRINKDQSTFEKEGLDENDFVRHEKTQRWVKKPDPIEADDDEYVESLPNIL